MKQHNFTVPSVFADPEFDALQSGERFIVTENCQLGDPDSSVAEINSDHWCFDLRGCVQASVEQMQLKQTRAIEVHQ